MTSLRSRTNRGRNYVFAKVNSSHTRSWRNRSTQISLLSYAAKSLMFALLKHPLVDCDFEEAALRYALRDAGLAERFIEVAES